MSKKVFLGGLENVSAHFLVHDAISLTHIATYKKFSDILLKQPIKFEIVTGGMQMNQFRVSLWVGSPLLKIVPPPIISKSIRPHLYKKYYEKHSSETYTSEHIKLTEPDRLLQVSFEYGLS